MIDLRTRLEALRQALKVQEQRPKEAPQQPARSHPEDSPFLEGWERTGKYTFRRKERIPLDPGSNLIQDLKDGAKYFLSCPLERLYWFDTETTGLSGGAGTLIFLFGVSRMVDSGIEVQQFFLTDFPGEVEFLKILLDFVPFSTDARFISYNGSAYDAPLLKTRFILQRLDPPAIPQVDLLYLVRRLWKKNLPDCSLGTVERFVLDRERANDLPGRLIPQVYFEYLRSGTRDGLQQVIQHHTHDLLSLIYLFAKLGSLVREPVIQKGLDATALGLLAAALNPAKGWELLELLAKKGDPVAIERVSKRLREQGKTDEGQRIRIPYVWDFFPVALEELKHLEHVKKDYERALELAQFWLQRDLPPYHRADLQRRIERLQKKTSLLFPPMLLSNR